MAIHNSKNKTNAKELAKKYRKKGFQANVKKCKEGWKVYTYRSGS